jgi:hypothetical protein
MPTCRPEGASSPCAHCGEFTREFPHQVRLAHADQWRGCHTGHAVCHLDASAYLRWTDGGVFLFGFKNVDDARAFKAWSDTCGIDWSLPANEQAHGPSKPPQRVAAVEVVPGFRGYQGN